MRVLLSLTLLGLVVGEQTFFEVDPDFKAMHRGLLQAVEQVQEEEKAAEPVSTVENKYGPTRYFQQGLATKPLNFLMTVKKPIQLKVFKDGKEWDTFELDKEAGGRITGTTGITTDELEIDIVWKDTKFPGFTNPAGASIQMSKIKMTFELGKREYTMKGLSASYKVEGQSGLLTSDMKNRTKNGYSVVFPPTLSFTCYEPGLFGPATSASGYTAGLLFPGLQLQIGKDSEKKLGSGLFGPAWDCGVVFPIGLWVGLILSLFFAIICCWGFTMLANINTMDRFDDPKGKSINVPQSD
jgi:hypothetical protein